MLQTIDKLKRLGRYEDALQNALGMLSKKTQHPQLLYKVASLYDVLGQEQQAIPFYQAAIQHKLSGQDLQDAYLGLGSTYRALGRYQESLATFDAALALFPEAKDLKMFRAMTLYNLGHCKQAVSQLLIMLTEESCAEDISRYRRAIIHYCDDLDRIE
ncbi:MAG: tetratricopeptide repeat protein [Rouxiella aceris]|jgi:tetratricopeptide (TPR) repeat protein|uniref:Tetratricopeptide repeat protein n=1 Tax=Rouxiella aceris TaxID=2703884 RepID=A0A848MN62_9GAMM|nr:tetratricopeptide repeat protein [Rouxiella aceris]MDR3430544.1 tetratricopeptide repeat protein [Rouxiella aceris]NMP29205.1 tetratricopeptide repeat protein [Rouxiella aceris]